MTTSSISLDLLNYLKKVFPDSLPEQPVPSEQLGILIGQQSVIRHLEHQYRIQNKPRKVNP